MKEALFIAAGFFAVWIGLCFLMNTKSEEELRERGKGWGGK